MLAGDSNMRKQKERRVSNLSIGDLGANKTPTMAQHEEAKNGSGAQGDEEQKGGQPGQRRSLFRTSIDNDSV